MVVTTSKGKTHIVVKATSYFPNKDVINIVSMSVLQHGILVQQNNRPIAEVRELKNEIALAESARKDQVGS
jgi:hypothetical protein